MAGFQLIVNSDASEAVGDALEDFMEQQLGPRIQANAQRLVPVDTGDLKKSIVIAIERAGQDVYLQVGVDDEVAGVDYGQYVEEGTSIMAAQPYLRPAVYQAGGRVV